MISASTLRSRLMLEDARGKALFTDLSSRAMQGGFLYADTLPWFQGKNLRKLTNSFIDTHPNRAGHAILASGMADFMVGRMIPELRPLQSGVSRDH